GKPRIAEELKAILIIKIGDLRCTIAEIQADSIRHGFALFHVQTEQEGCRYGGDGNEKNKPGERKCMIGIVVAVCVSQSLGRERSRPWESSAG
ncbi:MAG TPA: hypothetical protein VFK94_02410, partial [Patescibacteria group bacterium]|nr:hypothetical protein [Patescibacteria group bacterium]